MVAELFTPPTDDVIQLDEASEVSDEEYDVPDGIEGNVLELKDYIATPTKDGIYVFEVAELRASEVKWLNKGILANPTGARLCISYKITSMRSDGEVQGRLEASMQKPKT